MRVRLLVVAILVLAVRAPFPVARADAPTRKVWVYFRDKGPDPRLDTAALSPRARVRRALRGSTKGATFEDLPLAPSYVAEVAGRVTRVSSPPISTRPEKRPPWKCGTSPDSARSSDDLPDPEGPSRATTSCSWMSSETSRSAQAAPG